MNKGTLLIVDDTPANVSVLYNFLTEKGFKVLVTQEGKRAIQKAKYAKPDLILLDVLMQGMDGFETCQILKSDEETKDIPIIFMTALSDTVDKVKGFKLGAADYITKPFEQEEVLARVVTQLNFSNLKKQLEIRTLELEKRNMELDAFARTVAHDLKNPLNAVIGYTEMLEEDCSNNTIPNEETKETLHLVIQAGQKMFSIIKALLLLAGITKQTNLELQPLDMANIITQVSQRLSYMSQEFQPNINLPEKWPVVLGYAPWVEEIWTNYISNAIKYGGKPPRVELGADPEAKGMIRFWVQDNGTGLTPEAKNKLFTPFTRLHGDSAEGHGLGLSIVQQIVEKLNGQIGVETQEGKGSRFYFTLPVAHRYT
ncbi:MAG: hybrid sensor histidine kinase/response regulator [Gammaproteobacteria bacterium]|nr:MAG: hybrid sensor histidine kinase/response regulator [Gammaproteobacteria bacterium]